MKDLHLTPHGRGRRQSGELWHASEKGRPPFPWYSAVRKNLWEHLHFHQPSLIANSGFLLSKHCMRWIRLTAMKIS